MISQHQKVASIKALLPLSDSVHSRRAGVSASLGAYVVPLVLAAALYAPQGARAQELPVVGPNQNANVAMPQEREVVVTAQRGQQISFNVGSDDGVALGTEFDVRRNSASLMRVRVIQVSATQSTAQIISQSPDAASLTVGERVGILSFAPSPSVPTPPSTSPSSTVPSIVVPPNFSAGTNTLGMGDQAQKAMQRTPKTGDYIAALAGLALVLSSPSSPSSSLDKAFLADQQFSVISPFPGGGYSVLPSGELRPGGAFAVNIPIAYAPDHLGGVVSVDVAQNRSYQSITNSDGRNGTVSAGIGFGVAKRPLWLSSMFLSGSSFTQGGDAVYNVLLQLAPETKSVPALAIGVQDASNERERSPFLVATKALRASRPLFATLGVGRGRFAGSTIFGGISYSPTRRLSLSTEYDGLQLNVGAGYAVTNRFSLLASYNDLAKQTNRPAGALLGRRYQLGANYGF